MTMKNILFCICCCCLVTIFSANAVEQPYWVLGSFKLMAGATKERSRLENITGLPVHIATFTDSYITRYRLVVEMDDYQDQRQMLRIYGIEAWRMSIDPQQINLSGYSRISKNTAVQRPMGASNTTQSARFSASPAPEPVQQLQNQVIMAMDVSAMSMSELLEFCSIKATRAERVQYCKNPEVKQKVGQ